MTITMTITMKTFIRIMVYGVLGGGMLLGIYSVLTVPAIDAPCNPARFYHPFC
jgi:hypothetical protein